MEYIEQIKDVDYWLSKGYDPVYHTLVYKDEAIVGYVARPDPVPLPSIVSKFNLLSRFTEAEKALIYRSEHEPVQLFLFELSMSSNVDLDLPQVKEAVQLLSDLGIIATSRVEEILSKEAT